MRTGILLAVIGIWVVLRTVRTDAQGKTLVDHVTGK
jgi:hypothetical protein